VRDFGLYIVATEPILGYERFIEICTDECVPMLQLRDKLLNDRALLALARRLKSITTGSSSKLLINDRPDLAILGDLDGVHLGPDDTPWDMAIKLLPPDMLLGVSTHSIAEVQALIVSYNSGLAPHIPNYMSFGPIYSTPAKAKPDAVQGTQALEEVITIAPIPLVAIGGIFAHNLSDILAAGARNIAMIRHFTLSRDETELRGKIRQITQILKEMKIDPINCRTSE